MLLAQILPCFLGNTSWGCWGASPGVGLLAGGVQPFSWASDRRCVQKGGLQQLDVSSFSATCGLIYP